MFTPTNVSKSDLMPKHLLERESFACIFQNFSLPIRTHIFLFTNSQLCIKSLQLCFLQDYAFFLILSCYSSLASFSLTVSICVFFYHFYFNRFCCNLLYCNISVPFLLSSISSAFTLCHVHLGFLLFHLPRCILNSQ